MATGTAVHDGVGDALEYADGLVGLPVVVKADGLAEGKGVTVCATLAEAERAIRDALEHGRFGAAGRDRRRRALAGRAARRASIALCDGERYALLPAARDHKRLRRGRHGPNTGGMGAYSPVAEIDDARLAAIGETVIAPVLRAMADARHSIPRRALRRPDAHLGRAARARVQRSPGRPGDAGHPAAAGVPLAELLLDCATGSLRRAVSLASAARGDGCAVLAAAGYPDAGRPGR